MYEKIGMMNLELITKIINWYWLLRKIIIFKKINEERKLSNNNIKYLNFVYNMVII
jgi:hypothetical protein